MMLLIVHSTSSNLSAITWSSSRTFRLPSPSIVLSLFILCSIPFVKAIADEEEVDEVDTAFSGILSQIDTLSRGRGGLGDGFFGPSYGSNYGSHSLFGGSNRNDPLARLLPRVASIASRVQRVVGDLYRIGLVDEGLALKFNLIRLASQLPGFENAFGSGKLLRGLGGHGGLGSLGGIGGSGGYGPNSFGSSFGPGYNPFGSSSVNQHNYDGFDDRRVERRLDDFDDMIKRYSKESAEWQSLSPEEREKKLESHKKTLTVLDGQKSKLLKKSFYMRNRIEFLINDMSAESSNSPRNNQPLVERLTTWKKFIENNEMVMKSQLTREERDTLYSFLSRKFKEIEPDVRQAEDHVFDFI